MRKSIKKLFDYCVKNGVEINFSPDGIGLWSHGEGPDMSNEGVTIDEVEPAVDALVAARVTGWETK